MAPEQCDPEGGRGQIGPAADVWGLGATLHHSVSGSRPFPLEKGARESEGLEERFPQLFPGPEPLGREIPGELVELIFAMLDPDPAARPVAAEAAERLEPLVAELPRTVPLGKRGAVIG